MKKRWMAGIMAGFICCSVFSMPASAVRFSVNLGVWGGRKELDDRGMIEAAYAGSFDWEQQPDTDYSVFLLTKETDYVDGIGIVKKYNNKFAFVLKPWLDAAEADAAVTEIIHHYYPEYEEVPGQIVPYFISCSETDSGIYYEFVKNGTKDDTAEKAEAIKQELIAAGLISRFYDVGQIGRLYEPFCPYPTAYYVTSVDPEAIQAYIDTAGLDCTLQYSETHLPNGNEWEDPAYYVVPNEELSYEEHFALAVDLYEALGIYSYLLFDARLNAGPTAFGQNALEYPGDLNIDGTADVSDAVLLARIIAEDDNMPAICDTGYLNADVDGDGLLTILDVTALLETLVN